MTYYVLLSKTQYEMKTGQKPQDPTVTFRLPPDIREGLFQKAEQEDLTVSQILRRAAVREMKERSLEKQEAKAS